MNWTEDTVTGLQPGDLLAHVSPVTGDNQIVLVTGVERDDDGMHLDVQVVACVMTEQGDAFFGNADLRFMKYRMIRRTLREDEMKESDA